MLVEQIRRDGVVDIGIKWLGLSKEAGLPKLGKETCVGAQGEEAPGGKWATPWQRSRKC